MSFGREDLEVPFCFSENIDKGPKKNCPFSCVWKEKVERFKKMCVIEMMCENENVNQHVTEWEKRCLKAEEQVEQLKEEVARQMKKFDDFVMLAQLKWEETK